MLQENLEDLSLRRKYSDTKHLLKCQSKLKANIVLLCK